ncbi:MAG: hypothetical protein V4649_10135 [Bacteroidota bacterium]
MQQLTEEEVALIELRISHGVSDGSLRNDLLDHYCCYVEEQLSRGCDFETAYNNAAKAISPNGTHEIQEELFFLLTFKKQTNMKRIVLSSGVFSALLLSMGIVLKFLHMPGASVGIVFGVALFSLLFLPALAITKMRERQGRGKLLPVAGTLSGMLISFSVVFLVMHWPGAIILGYLAAAVLLLAYAPLFVAAGLRQPGMRTNSIVTVVLIIAGCGLWLTLVASPKGVAIADRSATEYLVKNERILQNELKHTAAYGTKPSASPAMTALGRTIFNHCEALKAYIIKRETGIASLVHVTDATKLLIKDHWIDNNYFTEQKEMLGKVYNLSSAIAAYNAAYGTWPAADVQSMPTASVILKTADGQAMVNGKAISVLNELIQLQMIALQNEMALASR